MTCSKPFTITIEESGPSNWWKAEEPNGNRVDSIAGAIIGEVVGVGNWNSAPAVILDGINFTSGGLSGVLASPAPDPLLAYQGNGFDFFGWIILDVNDFAAGLSGIRIQFIGPGGLIFDLFEDSFNNRWRLDARGDVGSEIINYPFVFAIGVPIFWRVYFDNTTGKFGFQFNDGAIVETAASYVLSANANGMYVIAAGVADPFDCRVDEFGIFQRKLSTAQASDIWNGGSGRSYP